MRVYRFKAPKSQRTSTTIFEDEEHTKNIQGTHEECEEQRISIKHIVWVLFWKVPKSIDDKGS